MKYNATSEKIIRHRIVITHLSFRVHLTSVGTISSFAENNLLEEFD